MTQNMAHVAADGWPAMGRPCPPPLIRAANGDCDPVALRAIFACFATGVTVVTSNVEGSPVGMTVNSFSSTSLLPPLVLFCAANNSQTWPQIKSTGCFNVNILADDQGEVARRFADRNVSRFAGQTFFTPATGSPVLPDVLAYIDCVLYDTYPAGDHTIAVGQVVEAAKLRDGSPLVFFASTWGTY
jgi:3-hydroxy-9,10-secoandrosta-1,3,5(10)-triene-9,17-dione monooxygenase reductase component